MHPFVRARSSLEAFWAFDPHTQLLVNDPRFADFEKILDREHYEGVSAPIRRRFTNPARAPGSVKFAVMGHQGTGKSTLVGRAMAGLRDIGIMPVTIDALTDFDQADMVLSDVVLVIVRAVIAELAAQEIELERDVVEAIHAWFADELLTEVHKTEIQASMTSEAAAGLDIPALAKFAARFIAALKHDNEYRTEIRKRALRDTNVLINRANLLLRAAHDKLAARKQELCVVLDNLEKVTDREMVARAVLAPAQELRRLAVHIVWFLHPADDYAPRGVAASAAWPVITVPALPVRHRGDDVALVREDARNAVHRLLDARAELDAVFEEPEPAIVELARLSGGHVRDILRMAARAAELAEPSKIGMRHIHAAARWLAGHRIPLMMAQDWPRAHAIHATGQIRNGDEDARLLLHSCVLAYDGEPWWDVHPIVREHPEFERTRVQAAAQPDHGG